MCSEKVAESARGEYFDVIQMFLFLGIFAGVLVKGMGSKGRGTSGVLLVPWVAW